MRPSSNTKTGTDLFFDEEGMVQDSTLTIPTFRPIWSVLEWVAGFASTLVRPWTWYKMTLPEFAAYAGAFTGAFGTLVAIVDILFKTPWFPPLARNFFKAFGL